MSLWKLELGRALRTARLGLGPEMLNGRFLDFVVIRRLDRANEILTTMFAIHLAGHQVFFHSKEDNT